MNIKKTIPEIRAELFKHIEDVQAEYAAKGWLPRRINLNNGVIRGLLEVFIYGIYQLYAFLAFTLQQAVPKTATGDWLDMHAESVDIKRRKATKAIGYAEFIRDPKSATNIKIDKGKILRTKPDGEGKVYRYVVIDNVVLAEGVASVKVKIQSEDYGVKSNATVGQICELITPIQGISSVTNSADWLISEGADDETDAELYNRYIYRWRAQAGVTADAYKASALSVTGVTDVYIDAEHPRGQGTIDVYILGAAGLPTDNLLSSVSTAIAQDIIINDDVLVLAPTIVLIDVAIEIELMFGALSEITAAAENQVRQYFKTLTIGGDVIKDRMATGIININGVKKINWTAPTADVDIPSGGIAVLNSLNVTAIYALSN